MTGRRADDAPAPAGVDVPAPAEGSLVDALDRALDPPGQTWLRQARAMVAHDPDAVAALFPVAGRACGRGPLPEPGPELAGWSVPDAVRALLLLALPDSPRRLAERCAALYRRGDAAERRAVLRALACLPVGAAAVPVLRDALRANDRRLVAAALGPYAARHLDQHGWRQAVLKCVFIGVPLAGVAGLDRRADPELRRMLAAFAQERTAAGRPTPADADALLARLSAGDPPDAPPDAPSDAPPGNPPDGAPVNRKAAT